jgi:hypothetical protein
MVDGFVGSGNFVHVIIQSFQQQHAELLLMYISNGNPLHQWLFDYESFFNLVCPLDFF